MNAMVSEMRSKSKTEQNKFFKYLKVRNFRTELKKIRILRGSQLLFSIFEAKRDFYGNYKQAAWSNKRPYRRLQANELF
jgi:hypothetical protein